MTPPIALGARLRLARERAALTQAELGERAGLGAQGRQWVSQIEADRRAPSVATLRALCVALGVSADELLGLRTRR